MSKSAMTPDQLRAAGQTLFGGRWQADLTDAMRLRDSARLRAMLRGDRPIPAGFKPEIIALLRASSAAMQALADALDD